MKWFTMWLMRRYIRKYLGTCPPNDYCDMCPACRAWSMYERLFDLPTRACDDGREGR